MAHYTSLQRLSKRTPAIQAALKPVVEAMASGKRKSKKTASGEGPASSEAA